jgi:hypothetical protein
MVFIGQKQERALFTRHVAQSYPCNRSDCNSLVAVSCSKIAEAEAAVSVNEKK